MDINLRQLLREAGIDDLPRIVADPEQAREAARKLVKQTPRDGSGWRAVYFEEKRRRGRRF